MVGTPRSSEKKGEKGFQSDAVYFSSFIFQYF